MPAVGVAEQHTTTAPAAAPARLLAAARALTAERGTTGWSLDDAARAAGLSRATAYRAAPGGRPALLTALVAAEVGVLRAAVGEARAATAAASLEERLAAVALAVGRWAAACDPLQAVLAKEPEVAARHLAFRAGDPLLAAVAAEAAAVLAPDVAAPGRAVAADLLARSVVSHVGAPSPFVDLATPAGARRWAVDVAVPLALPRDIPPAIPPAIPAPIPGGRS